MAYRLPPLNSLRLFEAAGRHGSFKQAAADLHITPSAVSHGVATLEDWLGVALFTRGNRSLTLTPAGDAYLAQIRPVLEALVRATEAVPGRRPTGLLSVSVAPTFGLSWLIPRLPQFQERHPDIQVNVDTSQRPVDFPRDGVDVAIRRGHGDWPGLTAVRLVTEDLVPVCAPALATRIATPADLAAQTLLHVVTTAEDWGVWAELAGVAGLDLSRGSRFDTIQMAQQAAAQGLGVAIGRLPLAADDIAAGRLLPVLGPPVKSRMSYWLVSPPGALERPEVAAFRDWLLSALTEAPAPQRP